MTQKITIRPMKEKDRDEVLQMMRVFYDSPAVFHTSSDAVLERDITDCISDNPFVEGFVLTVGKDQECLNSIQGAECKVTYYIEETDPVGEEFILGYAMTAPSYTTEYGGYCVWLEDLYVKPKYRGLGIGSLFFQYMKDHYKDAVRFKLEVEPENERAVEVYKKNGYGVSPYWEMTLEMTEG